MIILKNRVKRKASLAKRDFIFATGSTTLYVDVYLAILME